MIDLPPVPASTTDPVPAYTTDVYMVVAAPNLLDPRAPFTTPLYRARLKEIN
jgi:hypothetical protein